MSSISRVVLEIQARHVERLIHAVGYAGALAVARPRVMEIEVLAQLAVHEDVGHADDGRQNVPVQAVGDDEARGAEQLEAVHGLDPRALVGAVLLVRTTRLVDSGRWCVPPVDLVVRDVADGAAHVEHALAPGDVGGVASGDLEVLAGENEDVVTAGEDMLDGTGCNKIGFPGGEGLTSSHARS